MPRKNPEKPIYFKKNSKVPSLRPHVDHSMSNTCDCFKCGSFMFLVVAKYEGSNTLVDELECFECKKIKRLGTHDPNRRIKKSNASKSRR